ncbi:hypothetical protein VTL71DRAFT_2849 [Oculimacula yallundae]|uniref:DUF6536 domain-containing protein n=1 Tax=Oculimacula yallundae TaxID=86028 RepID=A0ABR4CAT8_9HELO
MELVLMSLPIRKIVGDVVLFATDVCLAIWAFAVALDRLHVAPDALISFPTHKTVDRVIICALQANLALVVPAYVQLARLFANALGLALIPFLIRKTVEAVVSIASQVHFALWAAAFARLVRLDVKVGVLTSCPTHRIVEDVVLLALQISPALKESVFAQLVRIHVDQSVLIPFPTYRTVEGVVLLVLQEMSALRVNVFAQITKVPVAQVVLMSILTPRTAGGVVIFAKWVHSAMVVLAIFSVYPASVSLRRAAGLIEQYSRAIAAQYPCFTFIMAFDPYRRSSDVARYSSISHWDRDVISSGIELEDIQRFLHPYTYIELCQFKNRNGSSEHENLLEEETQQDTETQSGNSFSDRHSAKDGSIRFSGWRAGVLTCSMTALIVLVTNITLMTWAIFKYSGDDGFGVLYEGNCTRARSLSTSLHVLINVLSTVLLSASNYTMQCLNSPTRTAINKAHARKVWLDVGIPSWRNRKYVGFKSQILWWCLGFSSIPLHFLYNSSVFLDLAGQRYEVRGTNATIDDLQNANLGDYFTSITWKECESIYNNIFVFGNGDVYVVVPSSFRDKQTNGSRNDVGIWTFSNRSMDIEETLDWYHTYSGASTSFGTISISGGTSDQLNYTACFTETRDHHCRIKFSISLMAIVVFCNASKFICMFLTFWLAKESTFVTLGDAISSSLENPDPTTKNMCVVSKFNIQDGIWEKPRKPMHWMPRGDRTFHTTTIHRCRLIAVGIIGITIAIVLAIRLGATSFKEIGFGSSLQSMPPLVSTAVPMTGISGLLLNTILANLPQSFVSLINVLYNSLFTCMLLGDEWNSFAFRRQTLRVTAPVGKQRSKLYLTIPYRYAIPIIILSGLLHWLISESLFLVRITAAERDHLYDNAVSSMGYSPLGIALSSFLCFVMIGLLYWKALRKFKPGMPLVGSCSMAISAACHPVRGDLEVWTKPVQWGVTKDSTSGSGLGLETKYNGRDVGHCSFSSFEVEPPVPHDYYAGGVY